MVGGLRRTTAPVGHRGATWALGLSLIVLLIAATDCSRTIEEDPIPEHRLEPCTTWCAMVFDPSCPLEEATVPTEDQCFDNCIEEEGTWAPVGDGVDDCAPTYTPFIECMASLSCEERHEHFDLTNVVPPAEQSSCGELLQAQLDCQVEHY